MYYNDIKNGKVKGWHEIAWKNKGKNCQEQKEKTWQYFQEDGGDWIKELGIIVLLEKLKLYI